MFRGWHGCFLLTVVALLLQLSPYTGIFLMMLGAPFWPVILINLGFALMARDGWRDPHNRWLLAPPIMWFGGYLVVAAISHLQAANFNAALQAANLGKTISWNKLEQTILLNPDAYGFDGILSAEELVRSYGVNQAFEGDPARGNVRSSRMIGADCPRGVLGASNSVIYIPIIDSGFGTGRPSRRARYVCLLSSAADAKARSVIVKAGRSKTISGWLTYKKSQEIIIESPARRPLVLQSGYAQPLTWLPQPVLGCALNSGNPSWDCFAQFNHESLYSKDEDRAPNGADNVIAKALGLSKLSIAERYAGIEWVNIR